ncbi:hypothetical protein EMIHUDRAFT_246933 [Emiliania huxleyi CCMP1516]|uniref:ATP-grasp domain-containing protein n=2 Tax=Emiliania huxleyi TaxID=2903 RepID=A0A0D3IQ09_EMIH1|nr:hypothetical protein EMIHUDRAFT_246933 [Emiliania huxleyi CCMP1516]EOD13344.1 hypothetical protein EMIHUDRAFT_246933 [Emiliania huxleyi CCMP1516]|eukprot:XP_005765773.1 hypothetical protein EMIHUDRAFT_246933 [Emiliania huxleyi CCMP1516]
MSGQAFIVVDPVSTGGVVAVEAMQRGYSVIIAWSEECSEDMRAHVPDVCKGIKYHAEVEEKSTIPQTAAAVKAAAGGMPIAACIVGAETGVTLADKLSLELGSVQQRAVKATGLRAVREALGTTWTEVKDFVATESMPVVVKPVESAGSDGVKLCHTVEEAKAHFTLLMESQRKCGAQGAAEYVVDCVSRGGVHKVIMVWVYDKRPTNGSAFVYYGMIPVESSSEVAQVLIKYTLGVLKALKLDNGPTHGEVMMTADGPCMVEMNCRSHGWDGSWVPLEKLLTGGYSQPDVAVSSHVDGPAFDKIPAVYPKFKAAGAAHLRPVLYRRKQLLNSISDLQLKQVELTVDLFTAVGVLILANPDAKQLEADLATVRKMEKEGLFTFDEEIDPVQADDMVDMLPGRRLTEYSDASRLSGRISGAGAYKASAGGPPTNETLFAVAGAAFAAGALIGLLAAKAVK